MVDEVSTTNAADGSNRHQYRDDVMSWAPRANVISLHGYQTWL
jgi:hypothetical protein